MSAHLGQISLQGGQAILLTGMLECLYTKGPCNWDVICLRGSMGPWAPLDVLLYCFRFLAQKREIRRNCLCLKFLHFACDSSSSFFWFQIVEQCTQIQQTSREANIANKLFLKGQVLNIFYYHYAPLPWALCRRLPAITMLKGTNPEKTIIAEYVSPKFSKRRSITY